MSETSITFVEDRADLVYITKLINVDDFGLKTEVPNKEESETTIGSDVTNKPTESDMKLLEEISGARLSRKLKPFQISYAYGINANVGVINLTQDSRKELIFSSINSVVIYDYCTKKNKHLQAHPSTVNSISIDANGEYLVSTDEDKDGCLIVWCCKTFNPLFSIYKPYPDSAIIMAAISGCARYLVTMGDNLDYYSIDVWLWTLAEDKPKDTYLVNKTHGKPVKICFHPDKDEHIMVVFETQVFFLTWHSEENMLRPTIIPQIYQTNYKLGLMTCGTYMKYSHSSYVSTSTGCILLFRNTLYTQEYEEGPLRNKKMYINAVKVTKSLISTITATPNRILVTGDSRGTILFFDRRIKLLFWIKNPKMGKITAISFALTPKTYSFVDSKVEIKYFPEHAGQILECQYNDMEAEITDLIDTPKDVTMDNNPFLLSDFFISTADSNIFAYDFIRSMATPLFHTADAPITSIDAHDGRPYIVLGFENGRITLINYETKQIVSTFVLPKTKQIKKGGMVSSIKYSRQGLHLVCGRLNGEIWILDPSILQPKITEPFQKGRNQIMKIDFAYNSMQFAYYDNNRTVVLFNYNSEKKCWEFRGKIRSHSFPINDMMFFSTNSNRKSRLYTIGADRYMLQYNNWALNNNDKKPFIITSRDRIEQSALPMNFTAYTRKFGSNTVRYILFADNKHKIKVMHAKTKTPRSLTVAPSSDCFKDAQIRKMKIVPSHNNSRYMVFMTEKHLGISILPPDGNPFRNVGYMVHPKQVTDFALSKDGKQVFTFGKDDRCVLQWHIDPKSVELAAVMGGTELEPFYSFLDGGRNGAFVLEVEELFYYMQSLQQENFDVPRKISDCINLSEVPHLAKACGFFPSNFELEMMMLDIRFRDYDEDGQTKEEVSFVEFMKLLINHMPYDGYSIEEVDEHFKVLCSMADNPRRSKIDRNDFAALIQTDCDGFHNMHSCLTRLLGVLEFGPGNFNFLPTSITKNYLLDKILGLECEEKEEEGDDDYDFDDADFYVTSLRRMIEEDAKTSSESRPSSVRRPRSYSESKSVTDPFEDVNIFDNPEAFKDGTNYMTDDISIATPFGIFHHVETSSATSSGSTNLIKFDSDYSCDSLEKGTTTSLTDLSNKNLPEAVVVKRPTDSILDATVDEFKAINEYRNTNPYENWMYSEQLSDTNPFKHFLRNSPVPNEKPALVQEKVESEERSPTPSAPFSSAVSLVSDESDYKSFDVPIPDRPKSVVTVPPESLCSTSRLDAEHGSGDQSPDNMSSVSMKSSLTATAAEFKPMYQQQPQYHQWSGGHYHPQQHCFPQQQFYPQPQVAQCSGMMNNGVYPQPPLMSPPSNPYGMARPHPRPPPGFHYPAAYYQNKEFKYGHNHWYDDCEQQQQQMQSFASFMTHQMNSAPHPAMYSGYYNGQHLMSPNSPLLSALSASQRKDFYDFHNEQLLKQKQNSAHK